MSGKKSAWRFCFLNFRKNGFHLIESHFFYASASLKFKAKFKIFPMRQRKNLSSRCAPSLVFVSLQANY